jgi:uncharacterized membrane protein
MRIFFTAYISALVVMGILDAIWFSFSIGRIYRPGLGALMADKPRIPAAVAFYLLYIAGLTYLIVLPALATNQLGSVVWRGAVFGLVAYGTFDLTNLAIVRDWPLNITLIDLVWGTLLTGITTSVAFLVTRSIG